MRVWIEMFNMFNCNTAVSVTLHVRVWIEIICFDVLQQYVLVTLHVRVWIEIITVWDALGQRITSPST